MLLCFKSDSFIIIVINWCIRFSGRHFTVDSSLFLLLYSINIKEWKTPSPVQSVAVKTCNILITTVSRNQERGKKKTNMCCMSVVGLLFVLKCDVKKKTHSKHEPLVEV